jgi:hypothetical protein
MDVGLQIRSPLYLPLLAHRLPIAGENLQERQKNTVTDRLTLFLTKAFGLPVNESVPGFRGVVDE